VAEGLGQKAKRKRQKIKKKAKMWMENGPFGTMFAPPIDRAPAMKILMRAAQTPWVIGICVTTAASGSACSHGPTAPPTARTLAVTGPPPAIGATTQFEATITLSDGSTRVVTEDATWSSSNPAVVTVSGQGAATGIDAGDAVISATYQSIAGSARVTIAKPQCDATLWSHVYEPKRLRISDECRTATGVIMEEHTNADGDVDIRVAVDPPYVRLLNNGNLTNLNGWLQTEAICQAPIRATPDALRACGSFKGTVPVPPTGSHVLVTGTYVLDTNHGWMELHPITVLAVR